MTTTAIIVILAVLLIIGIVRSARENSQKGKDQDQPVSETPYVTSQEEDTAHYVEVYESPALEVQEEVVAEKPKAIEKKSPAPKKEASKKTPAKKAAPKKTTKSAPKKETAKKASK
jgi:outer membrane biosynthesis protein TonB